MSSDNIDISQNRKNLKRKVNQTNLDSSMNFEDEIINIKQSVDKMKKKLIVLKIKINNLKKVILCLKTLLMMF